MVFSVFFVCLIGSSLATSPIINETDVSIVPVPKPVLSVPRKCPPNEVLKSRVSCPPDTCDTLYLSFLCVADQVPSFVCTCKDNYLRTNSTGACVPTDRCLPPECRDDPNAQRGCGNRCKKTCADYNDTNKICENRVCKLFGCDCKEGFVYDEIKKRCVKPEQCPKKCKKPHERYSNCLLGECVPKTCEDLGRPIACPSIASPCAGGCICEEGYVRDCKGNCIEKKLCPKKCKKPHERYSNCLLGECVPKTCEDLGRPIACPSIASPCAGGCICEEGYVRDSKGNCIETKLCPKKCKRPHERYSNCLLGECVPKTCEDLGRPIACPSIASPCAGGCICEEGYVRDCKGNCIEKKLCPCCGGDPNAESGCGNPCGKTCASRGINVAAIYCPDYCDTNGCDCKKGFLLNTDTNKCVPEKDCPKPTPKCGKNEEYICGTPWRERSCQDPEQQRCYEKKCKLGCFCKKGYVRDANKKCVPHNTCPPPCKGPHERYVTCPASKCINKTCEHLVNRPPCPEVVLPCPGGCICEEGYLRNSEGKCIEKNKCPQLSCSANQTYASCSPAVPCPDKYCPKDDQPQPVCDPPRNCTPGCTCKINYRLDVSGKCIKASECPAINCTRENEVFHSCSSDCLAENCEDADQPAAECNTLLLNCQPKCVCKKGNFRNSEGRCVPAKDCPSVCKDPNAQWRDCKSPCPGTCQNTKPVCVSKACTAGCQCNEGYVLSKEGGKCVPVDTCGDYVVCAANQTFVPCTFRCPQVMCPESDLTILCKPPRDCSGGCGCKPNYRYNADDECILGSDCPPVECTRKNEEWSPCRSEYDYERCDDRYNSPPIVGDDDEYCNPRCTCIKGYYRNNNNECVPENECPPIL